MKLISKSDHEDLKHSYADCQPIIQECNLDGGSACVYAKQLCEELFELILSKNEGINYYDLRKKCIGLMCYDFSRLEIFLNQENVRKALGVEGIKFELSNDSVYEEMIGDWMLNIEVKIPALVEDGINLLVYAGEYDIICNWLGNSRWVDQMAWSGQKDFGSAKIVPFLVDNKEAGLMKNHGPVTFLKVHDAGHFVPMDQPKASLEMFHMWMQGKLRSATGRTVGQ